MQAIEEVLRPYQDAYTNSKDRSVLPRIITTGHSLGGALAVIAAVSIQHMFPAYQARSSLIDLLLCLAHLRDAIKCIMITPVQHCTTYACLHNSCHPTYVGGEMYG